MFPTPGWYPLDLPKGRSGNGPRLCASRRTSLADKSMYSDAAALAVTPVADLQQVNLIARLLEKELRGKATDHPCRASFARRASSLPDAISLMCSRAHRAHRRR